MAGKPELIIMNSGLKWAFMQHCPVDFPYNGDNDCKLWRGSCFPSGRGRLCYKKRDYYATRLAFMLANSLSSFNLCALHTCDIPRCINPKHLFEGTQEDNLEDMRFKGRQVRGTSHGRSKLKPSDVLEIKNKLSRGQSQASIAKEHCVCQMTISLINQGKIWQ